MRRPQSLDKRTQADIWPISGIDSLRSDERHFNHIMNTTTTFHWDPYDEHSFNCHFNSLPIDKPTSILIHPDCNNSNMSNIKVATSIKPSDDTPNDTYVFPDIQITHQYYKIQPIEDQISVLINNRTNHPTLVAISTPRRQAPLAQSSEEYMVKDLNPDLIDRSADLGAIISSAPDIADHHQASVIIAEKGIAVNNPWSENIDAISRLTSIVSEIDINPSPQVICPPTISTTWEISKETASTVISAIINNTI